MPSQGAAQSGVGKHPLWSPGSRGMETGGPKVLTLFLLVRGCRAHGRGQRLEGELVSENLQQGRDDIMDVGITRWPSDSRPGLFGHG